MYAIRSYYEYGIKKLDLSLKSGQLMGIMGPSGAGKTTLLNILNGTLKPNEGQVLINNINIHQDNKQLKKYIGYVPQDDALIEELSVWDNLLLNAKLCFKDIEEARLITIVTNTLKELELYKIKDLKIGKPVEKIISGGQRKRLNIARITSYNVCYTKLLRRLLLTEPSQRVAPAGGLGSAREIERTSIRSPMTVPVPWVSMNDTVSGSTPEVR